MADLYESLDKTRKQDLEDFKDSGKRQTTFIKKIIFLLLSMFVVLKLSIMLSYLFSRTFAM
jgi:hypothetical protein